LSSYYWSSHNSEQFLKISRSWNNAHIDTSDHAMSHRLKGPGATASDLKGLKNGWRSLFIFQWSWILQGFKCRHRKKKTYVTDVNILMGSTSKSVCGHILNYLLTHSMEQSHSWEANQYLQLVKKFPAFLWNPNIIILILNSLVWYGELNPEVCPGMLNVWVWPGFNRFRLRSTACFLWKQFIKIN
jgi:hypothetical protein